MSMGKSTQNYAGGVSGALSRPAAVRITLAPCPEPAPSQSASLSPCRPTSSKRSTTTAGPTASLPAPQQSASSSNSASPTPLSSLARSLDRLPPIPSPSAHPSRYPRPLAFSPRPPPPPLLNRNRLLRRRRRPRYRPNRNLPLHLSQNRLRTLQPVRPR